jgi:hypothetical protein
MTSEDRREEPRCSFCLRSASAANGVVESDTGTAAICKDCAVAAVGAFPESGSTSDAVRVWPLSHGAPIAGVVLATVITALLAPRSASELADAGAMALVAFGTSIFLGMGVLPGLIVVSLADTLRHRQRSSRGIIAIARGITFLFGLSAAALGLLIAVAIVSWRASGPWGWGWPLRLAVLGPCSVLACMYGVHLVELAVRLRSQHSWLRYVR